MTSASDRNYLNVKYLKLVNNTIRKRKEWSYEKCLRNHEFELHWAVNESSKQGKSQEEIKRMLAGKERDAKKASKGDRIVLCQNHFSHGHRVTHVVEIVNHPDEAECQNGIWTRRVQVVWVVPRPLEEWNDKAPWTKEVIGEKFSFKGGNLVSINAPTIDLNLDMLRTHLVGGRD
ncbi:hypothetical protein H6F78_01585 [Coleofasciculus sp. FACHB-64]|uniref:hypothetical protein n=1 Tax=Cyanophyceae TaxID=3028117 RepID=UPI0016873C57|nr:MULTISPECIES: hypothetical protein [unclassified Coleofasciculus]MBD1944181.1 hypothetical protein [Coleofasciculus sp. FACHB-712]MBD2044332.1 hypothetical protein [Coleofasciculus sp. FACHB-64]